MAVKPHAQIISQTPSKMVFARGGVQGVQSNTAFEDAREAELPKMPRSVMEEAIQVYLPSLFKFYTFKDLYIKPMRNRHRAKLAKAFSMRSPRPVVEVIDSLLYTSNGDTHLAYKLCREDFTYLQYWIRLNFFTKTPLMVTAQCQNPEHIQKVEEGKLSAKSLEIRQEIQELKPQVKDLPEDFEIDFTQYNPTFEGVQNVPQVWRVGMPTIVDTIDIMDDESFIKQKRLANGQIDVDVDYEYTYLLRAAVYLQVPGMSLKERCDLVGEMGDDDFERLASLEKAIPTFGVDPVVKVRCKECGAVQEVTCQVDAHSFFPELF